MLDVGDGHQLWWSESGTPDGAPRCTSTVGRARDRGVRARLFDPAAFRGVLFDQRGCGRSRPLAVDHTADLATNTTDHLVADIEALRQHLGIDRWVVVGVSWGATLALVYAQRHPERVRGVVLGAVTSGTRREIEWITRDMGRVFPAEWDELVAGSGGRAVGQPGSGVRPPAGRPRSRRCATRRLGVGARGRTPTCRSCPAGSPIRDSTTPDVPAGVRPARHPLLGQRLLPRDGEVLAGMDRIAEVPGVMVHGRHDVSGPLEVPYRLHQRWPASRLVVVDDAGHGGGSFGDEFVAAVDSMRELD
jgi:proline iminopeptidase